jgi:hypothetical protein
MSDEHQHSDEPTDDEREETISDLEPSEEDAEDVRGGQAPGIFRKVDN